MALIPLGHLEAGMTIIIETMPNKNQPTIEFVKYFAKQWLNGDQSPEIWNHHETIGRRTNNSLEGYHHKIEVVTDKSHPKLQIQIDMCKRENAQATDKFNRLSKTFIATPKDPKEIQKDQELFLIHEEFKSNYNFEI